MAFNDFESSNNSARPIVFYEFSLGPTFWRYTSADKDKLLDGVLWKAVPISDDGVKQTGEVGTDALTIRCQSWLGPVQAHMESPPATPVFVVIKHKHDDDDELIANYCGEVSQVALGANPGEATIVCETLLASMQRDGLRLGWQRTCPFAVYDPLTCKLSKVANAVLTTILSISGFNVILANDGPDGTFDGGFIEWTDPIRGLEMRTIERQVGNAFAIFGSTRDLHPGLGVTLYPGCARTKAACIALDNLDNFGGFEHMPGRSPYDGNPVFY